MGLESRVRQKERDDCGLSGLTDGDAVCGSILSGEIGGFNKKSPP